MSEDYATDLQSELDYGSPDVPSRKIVSDDSCPGMSSAKYETTLLTVSSSKTDPSHYNHSSIQSWDYIAAQGFDFFLGNAIKYISRAGLKPGESEKDDLKKAIVYLQKKLSLLEE